MPLEFKKAQKQQSRLRIALIAPSGQGKTYGALRIATGLGGKIAFLDTEQGSGSLYADKFTFDALNMNAPYQAEKYIAAIKAAGEAGYDTLIIDSLTHAWAGEGGLLDQQGKIADSGKGNSFTAWRTITPMHNKLVDAILSSSMHIIVTMRAKAEYILEENDRGQKTPKKIGMAPIQREGMDYEFTLVFDLDKNHNGTASKDRTSLFDGKTVEINEDVGKQLNEWLKN